MVDHFLLNVAKARKKNLFLSLFFFTFPSIINDDDVMQQTRIIYIQNKSSSFLHRLISSFSVFVYELQVYDGGGGWGS